MSDKPTCQEDQTHDVVEAEEPLPFYTGDDQADPGKRRKVWRCKGCRVNLRSDGTPE